MSSFLHSSFDEAVQTVQSQHKVSNVQRFLPLTLIGQLTLLCVPGVSLLWFPLHTLLKFIIIHEQTTFVYEQHD